MARAMVERFSWVRDRYNAEPRESGSCACGHHMTHDEYTYAGGSHGRYVCNDCGRDYVVDVNGVMWERTPEWLEATR